MKRHIFTLVGLVRRLAEGRREKRSSPRAFTLVELLVVIGIISILISMLLPALNKAREAVQTVTCLSNLRQVMQGLIMYAQDNKGSLPYSWDLSPGGKIWSGAIGGGPGRYVRDPRVFFCPSRLPLANTPSSLQYLQTTINQPSSPADTMWAWVSYSASAYYGPMPLSISGTPIKLGATGVDAASRLILTEGYVPAQWWPGYASYGWYNTAPGALYYLWTHPGGLVNCAFLDGHCASLQAEVLGWKAEEKIWDPTKISDANWMRGYPWSLITMP